MGHVSCMHVYKANHGQNTIVVGLKKLADHFCLGKTHCVSQKAHFSSRHTKVTKPLWYPGQ